MSRDCSWDRYWGRAGQLLANFFSPVIEPQTSLEKLTWHRLLSFLTWPIVRSVGLT